MNENYEARTLKLLEEVKAKQKLDFEVLKVEYVREDGVNYLRAFCDMKQEGGIGAEDCAKIARPLSRLLDREDFIPEEYMLEVCSPGFMVPANETEITDNAMITEETENE